MRERASRIEEQEINDWHCRLAQRLSCARSLSLSLPFSHSLSSRFPLVFSIVYLDPGAVR